MQSETPLFKHNTNNRPVITTFRLETSTVESLRHLADGEGVSVNVLANRALRKFAEFDAYRNVLDLRTISGKLLQRIMEVVSEEDARSLGEWAAKNLGTEFARFWFKRESLEAAIRVLDLFNSYGNLFTLDVSKEDERNITILVSHGLGQKWSLFFESLLNSWLGKFKGKEIATLRVDMSENVVVARVTTASGFQV